MYLYLIIIFLLAVLMSLFIFPQIIEVAYTKKLFDEPDHRKLHKTPIPRLGGFAFLPIISFTTVFISALGNAFSKGKDNIYNFPNEFSFILCGLILLYLLGVKDDLVGVRYRLKFVIQTLAALMIPLSGVWINNLYGLFGIYYLSPWVGIPFTILAIVFIINSINLIDGLDGLASGLSIISLLIFSWIFITHQLWIFASISFAALGVLFTFFCYNVFGKTQNQTKLFMGDTGSLIIGFIISFLLIKITSLQFYTPAFSIQEIIIVSSPLLIPIFDAMNVMVARTFHGKGPFTADRNHIHHRILRLGFNSYTSLTFLLGGAIFLCIINMILIQIINITYISIIDILIWLCFNMTINKAQKKITSQKWIPKAYTKVS